MRGTRAKALRRLVYGDLSLKIKRRYVRPSAQSLTILNHPDSPRARYQASKRTV